MKKIFLLLLLSGTVSAYSQNLHTIHGEIRNESGKKAYLGSLYGEKTIPVDSVFIDPAGHLTFLLKPGLQTGLYRILYGKDKFLNLVLNNENIDFTTNADMLPDSTTIRTSDENKIYYYFLGLERRTQSRLDLLAPILDYYPEKDDFYRHTATEYERLQRTEEKAIDSISARYPGSFAVRIFRNQQAPFLSSSLTKDDRLAYLKQHFLDHVDFRDTLLLRSNAWSNKAISYLALFSNSHYPKKQLEAEFIKAITVILSAAAVNPDVYKFLLDYFVGGFDKYNFDDVITYIADNFQDPYACEDQARKTSLQKKLENFKKIAVGKTAPDIEVPDQKGKIIRLSDIRAEYTLLVFWSSQCGHCIEMMPKLKEFYDKQKPVRMEVMAVALDTSRSEWSSFIKQEKLNWLNTSELKGFASKSVDTYNIFATPTMFLLDREKKIISKPISYRELEEALKEIKLMN